MDTREYKIFTNNNKEITNKDAEYIKHLYDTGRFILIECTVRRSIDSNKANLQGVYTEYTTEKEYSRHNGNALNMGYLVKVCDCINHRDKSLKWQNRLNAIKSAKAYYKDDADGLAKALKKIDDNWKFLEGVALGNTRNI